MRRVASWILLLLFGWVLVPAEAFHCLHEHEISDCGHLSAAGDHIEEVHEHCDVFAFSFKEFQNNPQEEQTLADDFHQPTDSRLPSFIPSIEVRDRPGRAPPIA